jgi:hypothetical protein
MFVWDVLRERMTKTAKASDLKLSLCKTCGCMTITKLLWAGTGSIPYLKCGKCGAEKRD